jgi:predicted metal-dependent hydrolase
VTAQLVLPFSARASASLARPIVIRGRTCLVHVVRVRRARQYVLRIRRDGSVRLAIPWWGRIGEALAFVRSQGDWIERERMKQLLKPAARTYSAEDLALREAASTALPARLRELAREHGLTVTRVVVRNQRTLWGSCSRRGAISLNWRLMLMPPEVRDYILLHELAHLKHANHSRRFWAAVEAICPWYRDAHRWLRQHGATLH